MKINRELIIEKAFEQYLQMGYSAVSVSVLQKKLDIGRASMYYYFSTKESLFSAVMKRYVLDVMDDCLRPLFDEDSVTLPKVINAMVTMYDTMYHSVQHVNPALGMNSMSSLILYAMSADAEFADTIYVRNRQCYRLWVKAIDNGKRDGTIPADTDTQTAAVLFASVRNSFEYVGLQQQEGTTQYRNSYECLMKIISNKQLKQI